MNKKDKTNGSDPGSGISGCLPKIRALYPQLSRRERLVADYVLAHEDVIYHSITDFVRQCRVGYGTVMRFCRRMGCAGFQEFKIRMAHDLAQRRKQSEAGTDPLHELAERIHADIDEARQTLSKKSLKAAAVALTKAHRVLTTGFGGSAVMALEAEYQLNRYGIPVEFVMDCHMQYIKAGNLSGKDVVFLVSFTGSTKEILKTAQIAKQAGAVVICLINFERSPLADLADIAVVTGIQADPLRAEVISKVPLMFALDALMQQVRSLKHGGNKLVEKTFRSVADRQL